MPSYDERTWIPDLVQEFDQCQDQQELLEASGLLYRMRHFAGVRTAGVSAWRSRARKLFPSKVSVVAVDLGYLFYSSWAVRGEECLDLVVTRVSKIRRELQPDVFLVAADSPSRKKTNSLYKKSRPEKPNGFQKIYKQSLKALQDCCQVCQQAGMEADDLLSTISFRCSLLGNDCILVTPDKDLWQVLTNKVVILHGDQYLNEDWLMATHRIKPSQVVDWLCLVGGKNDLPGVQGIGPKTASEWLQAFDDFPGVVFSTKDDRRTDALREFYDKHYWSVRDMHTLSRTASVVWQQ